MRGQLEQWERRTAGQTGAPQVRQAVLALRDELNAIRQQLIDVNMWQAQLWPSGLHEKFNALFDAVDSADYAPSQQAREVFAELSAQLEAAVGRFRTALREQGQALDAAVREAGLPVVGLAG
ncbi:MAG: hypothetical protein QJR03_01995 [Sphaerobacter sp.]|nr:hypothetical protein [Sphaerobacter sp.]